MFLRHYFSIFLKGLEKSRHIISSHFDLELLEKEAGVLPTIVDRMAHCDSDSVFQSYTLIILPYPFPLDSVT